MNEHDPLKELIGTLRPDGFTADAYERRRSADLARAMRSPHEPHRLWRFSMPKRGRPLLALAGTAVAGLAAAVIVVPQVISDGSPANGASARGAVAAPGSTANPAASDPAATPRAANGRAVLLAAAKVAAKEPLGEGAYWYSRVRTSRLITDLPVIDAEFEALRKEYFAKLDDPDADRAEVEALKKRYLAAVAEARRRQRDVPFTAGLQEVTETWRSMRGDKDREVSGQDVKVTFASRADEAKWRELGSPRLDDGRRPKTWEGRPKTFPSMSNQGLTWADLRELPTDKQRLKDRLRSLYEVSQAKAAGRDLTRYLWDTGADLLVAPITPGTRAALYRVLADSASGLKAQTGVQDAMGRSGIALETPGAKEDGERGGEVTHRMIFDAASGRILQIETLEKGVSIPLWRQTFEVSGYVDRLGEVA